MGLEATEEYDGRITVVVLRDTSQTERIACSSYEAAIQTVKDHHQSATATKIVDRDGDVVFTSAQMEIDHWETEWKHAKRRLSVDVEEHTCPYDAVSCFADDLCVQCEMDKMPNQS